MAAVSTSVLLSSRSSRSPDARAIPWLAAAAKPRSVGRRTTMWRGYFLSTEWAVLSALPSSTTMTSCGWGLHSHRAARHRRVRSRVSCVGMTTEMRRFVSIACVHGTKGSVPRTAREAWFCGVHHKGNLLRCPEGARKERAFGQLKKTTPALSPGSPLKPTFSISTRRALRRTGSWCALSSGPGWRRR